MPVAKTRLLRYAVFTNHNTGPDDSSARVHAWANRPSGALIHQRPRPLFHYHQWNLFPSRKIGEWLTVRMKTLRVTQYQSKNLDFVSLGTEYLAFALSQARPMTRYLPVRSSEFNLRQHVESCGHSPAICPHVSINATSCRWARLNVILLVLSYFCRNYVLLACLQRLV